MDSFHFQNPACLVALLSVPGLWLVARLSRRWAETRLAKFARPESLPVLLVGAASASALRNWLFGAGVALLVVAWARPQGNPVEEVSETSGLDVLVLLDVSRSMDAEDVFPSRLKKAKKSIATLMDRMSGDRIGVVAFAGSAVVVSPLTSDYEAVKTFLESVDTALIENQGTDLEHAMSVALQAMSRGGVNRQSNGESSNVFVVMSDGETHTEKVDRAAESAKEASVRIFSIAFGTEKGAPIPVRDQGGELRGYKRSQSGETVITKVEDSALRTLSEKTGGVFYHSTFDEGEISDILRRTEGLTRSLRSEKKVRLYEEYFQIPLGGAALFLLLSIWPGTWIPRRVRWTKGISAALLVILPPLAFGAPWDSSAKRRAEEARSLLSQGKAEEARKIYEELQVDHPDAPELAHNLGLALTLEGKGEEGRRQLENEILRRSPIAMSGAWNHAGSYAAEKKSKEALAEFSRLVMDLEKKEPRSAQENAALVQAKKNLEFLARQNEEQKQNSSGGEKNEKDKQSSSGQRDKQEGKDGKKGETDPKGGDDQNEDQKKSPQNAPREGSGKKPFQEREDLSEQDANRMLETLRNQEGKLQRKFLKKKGGNSKVEDHGKDW